MNLSLQAVHTVEARVEHTAASSADPISAQIDTLSLATSSCRSEGGIIRGRW